jgi:hypothetical protein
MHIATTLTSAFLILFFWTFSSSTTHAIAFCILFGAFSGAVIGLPPAGVANILGNYFARLTRSRSRATSVRSSPALDAHERAFAGVENPHIRLGQWVGMMYSGAAVPALAGPAIAGALITQYDTYITVQMWSGVCLVISAGCMGVARYYLPSREGLCWEERTMSFRALMKGESDEERGGGERIEARRSGESGNETESEKETGEGDKSGGDD